MLEASVGRGDRGPCRPYSRGLGVSGETEAQEQTQHRASCGVAGEAHVARELEGMASNPDLRVLGLGWGV